MAKPTKRRPTKASIKAKADRAEARAKGDPVDETPEAGPLNPPEVHKPLLGRPPKYDPAYCMKVLEWGAQGKSRTWIAAAIGVDRDTIYEWAKQYAEFSDAITRAKALEQKWWEDAGQTNLTTTGFAQSAWSRSMAARFPDDWREVNRHEMGGKDGKSLGEELGIGPDAMLATARWVADVLSGAAKSREPST